MTVGGTVDVHGDDGVHQGDMRGNTLPEIMDHPSEPAVPVAVNKVQQRFIKTGDATVNIFYGPGHPCLVMGFELRKANDHVIFENLPGEERPPAGGQADPFRSTQIDDGNR